MERYISQRLIFDSDITRVGIESRIPTGLLPEVTLSPFSCHWG
jgi:hypothetical protein